MAEHGIDTLVADIITAQFTASQSATNRVIDNERRRADEAEATLYLVRREIEELLAGPYAPSAWALEAALYPSQEKITARIEGLRRNA
jgi:hypothetical protein